MIARCPFVRWFAAAKPITVLSTLAANFHLCLASSASAVVTCRFRNSLSRRRREDSGKLLPYGDLKISLVLVVSKGIPFCRYFHLGVRQSAGKK